MRPGVRWKVLPANVREAPREGGDLFAVEQAPPPKEPKKPRKPRPFKLAAPKALERPEQRSITSSLNKQIVNGGCFHIANESLFSFIPDKNVRHKLWRAMKNDGVLPGAPDDVVLLGMDEEQAAAIRLAAFLADLRGTVDAVDAEWPFIERALEMFIRGGCRVGFLEIKRPGWTPSSDKRWREGEQPKAHKWLASFGAPTAIVRDIFEAQAAVLSWGGRLRYRLNAGAGGGQFIVPSDLPLT